MAAFAIDGKANKPIFGSTHPDEETSIDLLT